MKRSIRFLLAVLLRHLGIVALYRRMAPRPEPVVLAYHGFDDRENLIEMFMPPSLLRGQLRYLATHHDVVSMDQVAAWLDGTLELPRGSVAITVDDGYRDNYARAFPLFSEFGTPVTIYLATDFIEAGQPTVVDRLLRAIENSTVDTVELRSDGIGPFRMDEVAARREAVIAMDRRATEMSPTERSAFLGRCVQACGLSVDDAIFADTMMSWDDIRAMHGDLVTFGAHTLTHPVLARVDDETLHEEIGGSKTAIEDALGTPCRHFAYPFGSRDAVSDAAVEAVESLGFSTAVVLHRNPVTPDHRFRLGRRMISIDLVEKPWGGFSESMFACEVSGLFDRLLR